MKPTTRHPEASQPVREQTTGKPYRAPAIISREPLEAIAGVCTPAQGGKGDPSCTYGSS